MTEKGFNTGMSGNISQHSLLIRGMSIMATGRCRQCKAIIDYPGNFCMNCGAKIATHKNIYTGILAVVFFVIFAGLYFLICILIDSNRQSDVASTHQGFQHPEAIIPRGNVLKNVWVELDASKLIMHPRREVEKIIGKPLPPKPYPKPDQLTIDLARANGLNLKSMPDPWLAEYSWGELIYQGNGDSDNLLKSLTYEFKNHPTSVEEALAMVGLDLGSNSNPRTIDGKHYFWRTSDGPAFISNGIRFGNVSLDNDLTGIELIADIPD
jgi:hypothetical protein